MEVNQRSSVVPCRAPTSPKVTIDFSMYPHIMETVLSYSSREALFSLRATSTSLRKLCDSLVIQHLVIRNQSPGPNPDSNPKKMWHDRQIVVTSSTGRLPFFAWGNGTTRPAALNYFADLSAKPLVESDVGIKVIDIVESEPTPPPVHLLETLTRGSHKSCLLRFCPELNRLIQHWTAPEYNIWDSAVLPDIDSVVYFQNLDDPVNTLSSLPPYTLGSHQYYELNPNRVVINITLDASKGGKIDTLRHFRFPFQADEDGFTRLEEVVVLFKDVSPLGSVLDTPTRRHGRHVVNDLLEWVACGQVKVALVNVEHVVARVLLWSDTDPSLQVIKDDIIGEYLDFYANYSAEETLDDPGLVRFMTVDEYAAEVGPELFAIETVC